MNRYDARDQAQAIRTNIWRSIVDAGCGMEPVVVQDWTPVQVTPGAWTTIAIEPGATYTNIGPAYAPEPPPKVADKPIHECNLLDYQKACKAFFARQGKS